MHPLTLSERIVRHRQLQDAARAELVLCRVLRTLAQDLGDEARMLTAYDALTGQIELVRALERRQVDLEAEALFGPTETQP